MIVDAVRRFLESHAIAPCRLGVAVSGGTDSTALLLALAELRVDGFDLFAAHVNHGLRGVDSDGDEAFVREVCRSLGVELCVARGPLPTDVVRHRGIEAAAREVRYLRLRELALANGAAYTATAHQQDDQAETVLMRLRRRSGIDGLRAIRPLRSDGFIRPFLEVRRSEIEAFLAARGVAGRHDRSNDDLRFERNRARSFLRAHDELVPALAGLALEAQRVGPLLDQALAEAEAAHVLHAAGRMRFVSWPDDRWLRRALLRRAIQTLDPDARDVSDADLARLTSAPGGPRVHVTRSLELVTEADTVVLQRRKTAIAEPFEMELAPDRPARREGHFVMTLAGAEATDVDGLRRRPSGAGPLVQVIQLPEGARAEFTVRSRRPGDRFQPLGLAAPKRLKDFLIDRRIAAELRDRLPLLVWRDEIVWIPGVELSDRFKVTGAAGVLYEVRMEVSGAGDDDTHAHVHG